MKFSKERLITILEKYVSCVVVVEGKKDRRALHDLGFQNIIILAGKPLFVVVEEVVAQTNECVILTDLDAEGKKLYARLKKDLQKHGVMIHNELRNFLFKETDLRQIEGLTHYLSEVEDRNHKRSKNERN